MVDVAQGAAAELPREKSKGLAVCRRAQVKRLILEVRPAVVERLVLRDAKQHLGEKLPKYYWCRLPAALVE